jgi:hypothetical protein
VHTLVISVFGRLRQEDLELEDNLDYIVKIKKEMWRKYTTY